MDRERERRRRRERERHERHFLCSEISTQITVAHSFFLSLPVFFFCLSENPSAEAHLQPHTTQHDTFSSSRGPMYAVQRSKARWDIQSPPQHLERLTFEGDSLTKWTHRDTGQPDADK